MNERIATLGGGCFWCLEALFLDLRGVSRVVSGYSGGHVPDPSYKSVCSGTTGHAEVVQVGFDPGVLSYDDLLRMFFDAHDPTARNRQGNDIGPQYRSIILTHDVAQRATAERIRDEIAAARVRPAPVVTEIEPFSVFYPAGQEHQDYFGRNPWSGYCQVVIAPKVEKFRGQFAGWLREPSTPAAIGV